jgi:glutamate synthase (ferredoxin)
MLTDGIPTHVIQDPIRWKHLSDVKEGLSETLPHLKGLENGDIASSAIKQVRDLL